jgi:hypothetical protein
MPDTTTSPASGAERLPGEFRYFENIDSKGVRMRRKAFQALFRFDPALPDDAARTWGYTYYDADPVAEAFVDEVYLKQGQAAGRAMIDQALEHGVDAVKDAPESLKRLFGELEKDPAWLDWEQVELGGKVFRRYGPHMYSFAGSITLEGYLENSVAKPLAFTGAYTGESANHRFLETAAFWVDVSSPGGMRPGGPGVKTALRVRLMHVFVRKRLLKHPEWKLDAWGVPISQGDAILTLMGGSVAPGMGLKALGYRPSRREIEAMMHFWRYVGHVMGVQPRWYPETVEDGMRLLFASMVKGVKGSGDDGRNLAQSYVDSYAPTGEEKSLLETLRKRLDYNLELGYTALFLPPKTFSGYKLPKPGIWRLHPLAQFPFIFAAETARRNSKLADQLLDEFAQWRSKRWLETRLGKRSAEYKAVESFTR